MTDPTAQDTINDIIFDIEDYIGGNVEGQETIDRMGLTVFLRRTINAYTTNKIIEELEDLPSQDHGCECAGCMVVRGRIADLKAFNHMKEQK